MASIDLLEGLRAECNPLRIISTQDWAHRRRDEIETGWTHATFTIQIANRLFVVPVFYREGKVESDTTAWLGFAPDMPTMAFDDAPAYGQIEL